MVCHLSKNRYLVNLCLLYYFHVPLFSGICKRLSHFRNLAKFFSLKLQNFTASTPRSNVALRYAFWLSFFPALNTYCINLHFPRQKLGPSFLRVCCPSLARLDLPQDSAWVSSALNFFTHLCFEHFREFYCGGWAGNMENSPNHTSALNSACRLLSLLILLLLGGL